MSVKKPAAPAVPEGSLFAEREGAAPGRKRAVSQEYVKEDADEIAEIEEANLDELIVPASEPPLDQAQPVVEESDIHDLLIEPSQIPLDPPNAKSAAKKKPEQPPVKRGRFFSSISSALLGVSQPPGASRSEIEKSLRSALGLKKKDKNQ